MPIRVSATLAKKICDEVGVDKADLEDYVWSHKEHKCFLCEAELNRSSDDIELDHDIPQSEGGDDSFKNLNPAHRSCNRYKKNHSTINVRPHLRFKSFWENASGAVNYKDALKFYDIASTDTYIYVDEPSGSVKFEYAGGEVEVAIHEDVTKSKNHKFCFVTLPISAVTNDDEIQPRQIKLNHLLSIATDLQKNPLHEQPACRVVGKGDKKQILLFDGQHKTIASVLNGNSSLTFKVYLNIEKSEAVHLVNSIQSRIKKLPLTPFELATKMSDEVQRLLEAYEDKEGSEHISEEGFIASLDATERSRAKSGISSAVIDNVISDENLEFLKMLEISGRPKPVGVTIKEAAFQNNVLKSLLNTKPLSVEYKGADMANARQREARNVIKLLNICYNKGFVPDASKPEKSENSRIARLSYQAALKYMCTVMRQLCSTQVYPNKDEDVFIEKEFGPENWQRISQFAVKFFEHPIWTQDLAMSHATRAFEDALKKNQGIDAACKKVGLDAAYAAGINKLPADWYQ